MRNTMGHATCFSLLLALAVGACKATPPLQPAADGDALRGGTDARATNLGVPSETRADVLWFSDFQVVEGARAGLLRDTDAVWTRTHTTGLPRGDVVTLWWVIFNHPDPCEHGEGDIACGVGDLFDGPDGATGVEPACVYGDGSLVGGNGTARFHDRLSIGEARDSCIDFFVAAVPEWEGTDHGLTNPEGAEIHLVLRSHGPRIPGLVEAQRSTFAGGCEEFLDPGITELEAGQCSDVQLALFLAPDP